jgi:hypothetical protein
MLPVSAKSLIAFTVVVLTRLPAKLNSVTSPVVAKLLDTSSNNLLTLWLNPCIKQTNAPLSAAALPIWPFTKNSLRPVDELPFTVALPEVVSIPDVL